MKNKTVILILSVLAVALYTAAVINFCLGDVLGGITDVLMACSDALMAFSLHRVGQVEQPHDLFVARTFITYDMTAGLQAEDFNAHRQHILTDREMYERAKEWYR